MLIKLAGKVAADPHTGQLTITFDNIPQLPFSELKLSFFGGPRAVLVTPPACGAYEATDSLTPWSGTPAVTESSNLEIDSGPIGERVPAELRPVVHGGHGEQPGGRVQPVLADVLAPGRRTALRRLHGADARRGCWGS